MSHQALGRSAGLCGRMSSTHGSNVDFCCERFSQSRRDRLGDVFNKRHAYITCLNRRDTESCSRAACMFELLMVKRGILRIPDNSLTSKDINDMLYISVLPGVSAVFSCMHTYVFTAIVCVFISLFPIFLCIFMFCVCGPSTILIIIIIIIIIVQRFNGVLLHDSFVFDNCPE